mmetsp:Transcript_55259/g.140431  ORF Transcript_55259/g.140431 Transcript_55259/m.140431 type:complete len:110 (-) Transcript_55259:152-481(-)
MRNFTISGPIRGTLDVHPGPAMDKITVTGPKPAKRAHKPAMLLLMLTWNNSNGGKIVNKAPMPTIRIKVAAEKPRLSRPHATNTISHATTSTNPRNAKDTSEPSSGERQ